MTIVVIAILSFYLCSTSVDAFLGSSPSSQHHRYRHRHHHETRTPLAAQPITYSTITLDANDMEDGAFLIRNDRKDILDAMLRWKRDGKRIDKKMMTKWRNDGSIFPSNSAGIAALQLAEKSAVKAAAKIALPMEMRVPSYQRIPANVYVNIGSDSSDRFVKASVDRSTIEDLKSGNGDFEFLIRRGEAFDNVTKLFLDEALVNKGDNIAMKLLNEYSMTSDEWNRYTNITSSYNMTTLKQVAAYYFRHHSAGDISGGGFIRRPGFPGTLAPGENFKESYPIESLPNYILHPWPAMQEVPFYVRWPPSHPAIFPPLLWIALNDMYTQGFMEEQLADVNETTPVIGGPMMEARDGMLIAKRSRFGLSYKPEDQIPHGGMLFSGGHGIPYYNPDHGPTTTQDEAEVDVPWELRHLTERWFDPDEYREQIIGPIAGHIDNDDLSVEEHDEIHKEEDMRRQAAEKIFQGSLEEVDEEEVAADAARLEEILNNIRKQRGEDELVDRYNIPPRSSPGQLIDLETFRTMEENGEIGEPVINAPPDEIEIARQRAIDEDQARRELWREKQTELSVKGRVRSRRELITYTVRVITDIQQDMQTAERIRASKPSSGKGKKQKSMFDVEIRGASLMNSDPFLESAESSSVGDDW